jgi:hypothetical protein
MSTPAVGSNGKGNSVFSVDRGRHTGHRYTPRFAMKTHDLSEDVVHHPEPEKAVPKVMTDCCCLREITGEKTACRSRLFDESIGAKPLMEGISCSF